MPQRLTDWLLVDVSKSPAWSSMTDGRLAVRVLSWTRFGASAVIILYVKDSKPGSGSR